jgi:hypothetical protein
LRVGAETFGEADVDGLSGGGGGGGGCSSGGGDADLRGSVALVVSVEAGHASSFEESLRAAASGAVAVTRVEKGPGPVLV